MRPVVVRADGPRAGGLVLLTGCLVLGMLGLGTVEAHAASLAGETLTSQNVPGSTLSGACDSLHNAGNVKFSVSGTATGPFPGTFTESGSFTWVVGGFLTDFSSTFTITSTSGTVTVTGSKHLVGNTNPASCDQIANTEHVKTSNLPTTYTATITGAQRNAGTATVSIEGTLGAREGTTFSENFASIGEVQLTSKEQCRNGGWQSFGFKNQGDCVSFVATGGTNPPSGS